MSDDLIRGIVNKEFIKDFLLGGKCECIIENIKTGNKFMYNITKNKTNDNMYFVNLVTGMGRVYCGYILVKEDGEILYNKGPKGNFAADSIQIQALMYVLIHSDRLPQNVLVQHLGRCSRCRRKLTDPESIRRGLGPECAKKVL